ncbi:MAG TPA: ABC transporter permease, partial [Oleiagrimonas sp.]|nr:ABC transporter permease [Oleiagrimonas sp.]
YREAQSYLQIMMIVLIIPSALMSMVPIKASLWMYLVPVMGQQLGVSQLLRGEVPSVLQVVCILAGSTVVTLVLGWVTARVYRSERLAISA